jgi:hypothetical protein
MEKEKDDEVGTDAEQAKSNASPCQIEWQQSP